MKTALLIIHVTGLAFGVGAATVLDLIIVRYFLRGPITKCQYNIVELASKLVAAGLLLLWISGIGFLASNYLAGGQQLSNPKVWAKVSIVAILTANGFFIHGVVLPTLRGNVGFAMWHQVSDVKRRLMLVSGALSGVSWYSALLLGATPQLNYVVGATDILIVYGLFVAVVAAVSEIAFSEREPGMVSRFQAMGRSVGIAARALCGVRSTKHLGSESVPSDTLRPRSPFRYANLWPVASAVTAVMVLAIVITQSLGKGKAFKDPIPNPLGVNLAESADPASATRGERVPDSAEEFLPSPDYREPGSGKEIDIRQHSTVRVSALPLPGNDKIAAPAGAGAPVAAASDADSLVEMRTLLRRADADLAALRLTTPPGDNAWDRFKAVLERDPGNMHASLGMQRIVALYVGLARGIDASDLAASYLSEARAVLFGFRDSEGSS